MFNNFRYVKRKSLISATAFLLSLSCTAYAQQGEGDLPLDTLATVGTQVIQAKDFLERFELMPWPQKDNKARLEYTKMEFLYSLIAEKLMSYEALSKNIGRDSSTELMKYGMERFFVKDELFKREVLPRIKITPQEIQAGLEEYAWELQLQVLGIVSKKEGEMLYKKTAASRDADSTIAFFRDSLYVVLDTVTVDFGGSDIPLEQAAYSINAKKLSHPFQSGTYGLVMFHLLMKYTNPKYANGSMQDHIRAVQKVIHERQEDSVAAKVFTSLLGPQRADVNPVIFSVVADSAYGILMQDSSGHKSQGLFVLSSADIVQLIVKLQPYRSAAFITTKSDTMTVREVLEMLQYNRVMFPSLKKEIVQAILNNNIKTVVQNELLAREGYRKNLQQSEQVRQDVSKWMDSRRSGLLTKQITDTVSIADKEILDYYRRNAAFFGAKVEVNIREILVDSVSLAQSLRKRIDKGEDMAGLARKYSKRKEWAARGGESGFFPITEHGDLGFYASTADSGTVVGPLRIKEGLTIFRVLEKRQHLDSLKQNFDQVKKIVADKLLKEKRQQTLDKYIGGLAKKYGVTVNERNLHLTKTTSTSMVTWRYIGWGGAMLAEPPVAPESQWVQEWLRRQNINP